MTGRISFYGAPKRVSQTYTYNTLGNQTGITTNPTGMTSRSVSIGYDSKGRYPVSTTNEFGQTSTQVMSPKWGKPTSITGIDGLITGITYDEFGREISRTVPQGYNITTSYNWSTSYSNSLYKISVSHPGKPDISNYFDLLGREVYSTKESWLGNLINQQKTYDAKGNLKTTQGPWTTGETGFLTTYNYDIYNRISSVVNNFGTTSYSYAYTNGNLTTQITNPASQVSSKVTDAAGKTTSATDYGGTLNYTYYSHGGINTVTQGANTLITNTYDAQGRQTQMVDINAGTVQYKYNALGILDTQINAKSEMARMLYDVGNRVTQKIMSPEGTVTYEYFPNGSGTSTGKLKKTTNYNGVLEEYTYDGYGRVATLKETVDGIAHTKTISYNTYDDPTTVMYPSGFGLNYAYDANGFLQNIKNSTNTVTIWSSSTMNGYEQYKTYSKGNGYSSTNTYNFGIPTSYYTTSGIQNLTLNWDFASGNLSSRVDANASKTENFIYDNLNRLTSAIIPSVATHSYSFASNGNLLTKTDAGTYAYGSAKINAVTQINPSAGNISTASQALPTYTSFLQPSSVSEGSYQLTYTYGADENRIKSVLAQSGTTINTRYYFGDYEKDITSGVTKNIHYISAGDGLDAIVVRENGTDTYYYTYTDHLGSILHITNNAGSLIATQNFDAWGRGRNVSWGYLNAVLPPSLSWLKRGYTGHEHLAEFNLINMNGRLYDPVVGRMLAVDNNIIGETTTQGYNRYSYALNNPLKYTDPDGEFPVLAALIGAGISLITNGIENRINGVGFFKGAIKAATFGAIGGIISAGIGNAASGFSNLFEKSLFQAYAHGFSGAALSIAQGGNGISGFLSGAISSSLGSGISALGMNRAMTGISQFFGGALSGGIGSSISGGKFWDGVRQGVITGVLNHAAHGIYNSTLNDPIYEYNGKTYSSKTELYGAILYDQTLEQLGLQDVIGMASILAGYPFFDKRFTPEGVTKGTSALSKFFTGKKVFETAKPTITGIPKLLGGQGVKISSTRLIGRFAARWIPVVGWGILAYDGAAIIYKTQTIYNNIVN